MAVKRGCLLPIHPVPGFINDVHFQVTATLWHIRCELGPKSWVPLCHEHQTWNIQGRNAHIRMRSGSPLEAIGCG